MGRNHFRCIREDARFDLIAVVDPILPNLAELPLLRSVEQALALSWDLALVAVPTEMHFELVHKLLLNDRHVLVEKPAAATHVEARVLVELAKSRSLCLAVGNIERCNPVVRSLQYLIEKGVLGRLVHLSGTRAGAFPRNVKTGNDVILDLAVHELDVFRMLLGPLELRYCMAHSTRLPGIIDTAEILLATQEGCTGSVHVNWLSPQRLRQIRVTGTEAVCAVDYIAQSCRLYGEGLKARWASQIPDLIWADPSTNFDEATLTVEKQETLKIQLDQLHRYLTGDTHQLATGEQLIESVEMVERAGQLARMDQK